MSTEGMRSGFILAVGALAGWYALDRPVNVFSGVESALRTRASCGSTYRVAPGDTLAGIALKAYGRPDYQTIFDANRDRLTSAARIDVGEELVIPCQGDARPVVSAATAPAVAPVAAAQAATLPPVKPPLSAAAILPDRSRAGQRVRFLTGSDFAPFADTALPGSGMTAEMVRLAMASAAPGRDISLSVVPDWSAHPGLLRSGQYDLAFPWYKPDCSHADRLSDAMRARCSGLLFSKPLIEIPMRFYVRAGDPLAAATTPEALFGKRLCRPASYFSFDLDQADLRAPRVAVVFPPSASDCFGLLARGAVDAVSVSALRSPGEISRRGLAGRVAEIPALASVQTLHVVAPEDRPDARADIALIDAGLADLHGTGRWHEIAARYLGAYGIALH